MSSKDGEPRSTGFSELGHFEVVASAVQLLEYHWCIERFIVVLGEAAPPHGQPLTVGMLEPDDDDLLAEVAEALGRPVRGVGLNAWEIEQALARGWGIQPPAKGAGVVVDHVLQAVAGLSSDVEPYVPQLVDELLAFAIGSGASDMHIECYEDDIDVRLRIDGVMRQQRSAISHGNVRNVVARLKVLARLDVTERRRAQDGRIQTGYTGADGETRAVDFRLSVVPGAFGEDAVLRVLDAAAATVGLQRLGLAAAELSRLSDVVRSPEGLLLVTGPTGSGKTTTLYSALQHVNTAENKILTVEDPIELYFDKVNQKQVSTHMGFADFARAFLRQDPDIILVGEIRDADTADAAVRAAQTGHLVLSTLHTIDSTRAVSRLRTLGVEAEMLASALTGVLAQRLVRRVCEHCSEPAPADEEQRRRLRLAPDDDGGYRRGAGCEHCHGRGVRGRTGIYELLVVDALMADMLAAGTPVHLLREHALANGMRSLFADAMDKARAGLIPLSEVLRVVPYRMFAEG